MKTETDFFKAVFENARDAMQILKLNPDGSPGNFIFTNKAASTLLGYSQDELLTMSPGDIDAPEDAAKIPETVERVITRDSSCLVERTLIAKDGRRIPAEVSVTRFEINGEYYFLSTLHDITERKQAEEELHSKIDELELIEDQLPVVIAIMDKKLCFTRVYGRGSPRFDREKQNMIGRDLYWYFQTDDPDYEPIRKCRRAVEEGIPGQYQLNLEGADISVTVTPHRDERGSIIGAIAVSTIVTELKQTERMLQEREAQLRLMMNQIPAVIWTTDSSLRFTRFYGTGATPGLAQRQEHLLGKRFEELYHESDPEEYQIVQAHRSALTGKYAHYDRKLKDGAIYEAIVEPLRNARNEIIGTIGLAIDVTDKKRLEGELVAKNRELENFAFRVSHDLKVPLIILGGYITIIKEEPDKCGEYSELVYNQAEKVSNLIDSLLKVARAGLAIEKKQIVDLDSVVESAFTAVEGREKDAELMIESPLPSVQGDPERLLTLFTNLFENSLQYRNPEQEHVIIGIRYFLQDDSILLRVSDNGAGIEPDMLEKIFEYGFSSDPYKKSGFGLATGKKIVEAHGGKIWAESTGKNQGATFNIRLPGSL